MIFSSFEFFIFLFVVVFTIHCLNKNGSRQWFLLAASYFFYGYWDYRFVLLIFFSTVVDYFISRSLYKESKQKNRRWLLTASITVNLSLLGFFKYYNFFVDSAESILSGWGLGIANLDIILPVGISFYTFQTLSYTIDIYRGKLKPSKDFKKYALYVAFFPQIVAGPIVRAIHFLPQLDNPIKISGRNIWIGSQIFLIGLFKKLMIADSVSPFVDEVYSHPEYFSSLTLWLVILAYSLQIYCDFSGYSDMAIGCAKMLGFDLRQNFNMPYLSRNITEFWRRWHISLSSWLRDYLYISLGGNRGGSIATYRNLMITMLLGGLWHGASWNFIIWGAAHGIALSFHKLISARIKFFSSFGTVSHAISVGFTFIFVSLIWVLFRAQDTETMRVVYIKLFAFSSAGYTWIHTQLLFALIFTVIGHYIGTKKNLTSLAIFESPYSFRSAVSMTFLIVTIFIYAPTDVNPFIYFQF